MEKGLISVDRWSGESQAYFLTHLHSDHTKGLSSSWSKGPIFCSRLTAKIFPFKFPDFKLSLLRILDSGSWHTVPLVSPTTGSKTVVEVIAIDAHHCPGDFRWETRSERAKQGRTMLVDALNDSTVDILYLDNTYCNPSYDFPPREVAAQQVVDIIASHPEHDIVIGIDSLGKEDLLLFISRALKIKIWVWPERLQIMHLLGFHDIFTTKTSVTRVRAVPRYSFSIETLEGLNTMRPTIGIMPSGLPWAAKSFDGNDNLFGSLLTSRYNKSKWTGNGGIETDKPYECLGSVKRFHEYIYSVAYSDHSSFSEIGEFVKHVQPFHMKGIVSSSSCYVDPMYYFGRLCGVNQPAQRSHIKDKRKDRDEVAFGIKSLFDKSSSADIDTTRGRSMKVQLLTAQVSRVRAFRRLRCGAKIVENDSLD